VFHRRGASACDVEQVFAEDGMGTVVELALAE
jgi:hypothetical protein